MPFVHGTQNGEDNKRCDKNPFPALPPPCLKICAHEKGTPSKEGEVNRFILPWKVWHRSRGIARQV